MSHSQLMLKSRLSFAWPLALTISSSTCVSPFWQRESSLGFPICVKHAFVQVLSLAKLSGRNDFPSKKKIAKPKMSNKYTCIITACRLTVSKFYWPADNGLGSRLRCRNAIRDDVGMQRVQKN